MLAVSVVEGFDGVEKRLASSREGLEARLVDFLVLEGAAAPFRVGEGVAAPFGAQV